MRDLDVKVAEALGWTPFLHKRGEYTFVEWGKPGKSWEGGGQPWERSKDANPADWTRITAADIDRRKHIDDVVGKTFRPSEDIADAWQVVEQFPAPQEYVTITQGSSGKWRCDIELRGGDGPRHRGVADTAPEAICLAFLKAKGVTV